MTIIERNGSGRRAGASLCRRVQCFLPPQPELRKVKRFVFFLFPIQSQNQSKKKLGWQTTGCCLLTCDTRVFVLAQRRKQRSPQMPDELLVNPISHLSPPGLVFVQSFPKLPKSAAQSSLFVQTSTLRLLDIVSQ